MKHQPKDKVQSFVDSIDTSLYSGVRNGIFHLYTQDTEPLDGRSIRVTGHDVINLGMITRGALGKQFTIFSKTMMEASDSLH